MNKEINNQIIKISDMLKPFIEDMTPEKILEMIEAHKPMIVKKVGDHFEEIIPVGHKNSSDKYVHLRAKELDKDRILYYQDKRDYPSFIKLKKIPEPTDLLIFAGPKCQSDILVWV